MSEAKKRARLVWYLYDFGNSAYAAVVLLAVYAAYFKEQVVGGSQGSFLWGLSVGIAMLIVALTSPILGAMADLTRSRKRFLAGYTAMACLFTVALFFVGKGDIVLGMALFILAEIGYRSAQVFYNSLLPDIAAQEEIGRISGNGWAIGSAGGIVCLVIVLITIRMIGGDLMVRFSLVITAIFFAVFAVPLFIWLREKRRDATLPTGRSLIALPFVRVGKTLRAMRRYRQFGKFILAFLIYNDAILMTLNFAAILGAVLYGLNQQQLILFMILVQVTSIPGAYLLGRLADRTSAQKALILALGLMLSSVLWMYFNYSIHMFFVIGAIAGFALTGVQSVSRTMTGMLAPPGRSAEFYGFFAVAGRTSSFIGPTVFGIVAARMAAWYQTRGQLENLAEQSGQRIAVLVIAAFLIVGAGLLLTVNEYAGRRASMEAE